MKNLYSVWLLMIIPFICHAQDTMKRSIPLFKASSKIDSLINSVTSNTENLKSSRKDSCILLGLFKTKSDAGFITSVHTSNHKQVIFDLSNFSKNKNCGYFEFNGYLIFIYGDGFMKEFFNNTHSKKEFTFIKPTTQEVVSEMIHLRSWAVFYRDGAFSWGVH